MIFSREEDIMYIKTTELKNRKSDILELLKEEDYSDKHILRFMKTFDLVYDLVTADICKTNKQLHCWFDRFFEGFNRNTYHSGLDQLVCYLENGTLEKKDRRPTWMRNPKFDALGPEYRGLITEFAESATKRGLEPSTIKCITGFGAFFLLSLQQQGIDRIVNIQESDILSFFEKGRSFTYHQSLRAFFRENIANQDTAIQKQCSRILELIPKRKNSRKNIQYFTLEETRKIKDALLSTKSPFTYRDRAVCIIAMYLGLRGSDIRNLKMGSIDWDGNIISLVQQKTAVPLKIPLLPIVGNAIYDYISKERPKGISTPEIFICRKQPYRKMGGMAYSLNVVLDYCGLRLQPGDRRGLHLFRHHLATSLLANDVPVPVISNILGHSQPSSTQAYLSSDLLHLKELGLDISEFPMYKETLQ
jgi:integrase